MNWQSRSQKPEQHFPSLMIPSLLAPVICKDLLYYLETKSFSKASLLPDSFGFLRVTSLSPPAVNCPDFAATIIALILLSSCLCRIKRKNSYSTCGRHLQDLTYRLRNCHASEPLWRAIFGTTSSIFDLWSRPVGVARLLGLCGIFSRPHLSEGVG